MGAPEPRRPAQGDGAVDTGAAPAAAGAAPAEERAAEPVDRDYPLTPVPRSARRSAFSITVVLVGFTIFAPTLMAGASVGAAFRFSEFLGVLVVGSLVLGTYVAAVGFLGARTGLTTVVMARYSFGTVGSKLASLLLGGTQVGWYGVAVGTIGQMTGLAFGWTGWWGPALIMIVVSALMMLTALFGYEGMYWVSLVSTPLILILAFWLTFKGFAEVGGLSGMLAIEPSSSMTWAAAVTAIVGTFASAGTQAANWTRFARSGRNAVVACGIGFIVGNGLMVFFGAVAALAFGEGDFTTLLISMGMIGWGLFFLFGNLWKSNADAAYAFGVAGAEITGDRRKGPYIIGGVIIGTILALTGIEGHITGYLSLLGVFIPPLGGVLIGDWLARWRRGQPPVESLTERIRWQGLVPYALGSLAAWVSNTFALGIAPLNGIVVALVLAWALSRFTAPRREQAAA
ncbi:cytosine permease [Brevibacterium sp. 5221]|uniref:Cytosine permease n=1 Tax=Brevibacterium rongguiense TaxID=2695267 RepID=A0A6N9H4D4_9MICO|nr:MULTISPECIES: cytosine permease [Brevibacterium]MYM18542.1 cytosine permease [Brevibacterium rongguiense]WAL39613.1 cytosine permease [Brevibacterium sp. BRM-1]